MNETDIKKCIKHGYAWSSCGDKPDKTPTKDYTRSQLKTFEGLHATKSEAQLAIAMRSEDAPDNDHAEVKCDMPETLMLNGKLHKRLAEGEPREIGDVPVDGSQTNRFGSVYYRPIAETPEQRDARINALVDGYIAKGGPITKEQLTYEVRQWLLPSCYKYYSYYGMIGTNAEYATCSSWGFDSAHPSITNLCFCQAYWNESDAKHAKMMEDGKTQMTPITAEQAKMLREGDVIWAVRMGHGIYKRTVVHEGDYDTAISHEIDFTNYFTKEAAQAALDKQKAATKKEEHKFPNLPSWCPPLLSGDVPIGFGGSFTTDGRTHSDLHAFNKTWTEIHGWNCSGWDGDSANIFYAAPRTSEIAKLNYPWLSDEKSADPEPPKWCMRKVSEIPAETNTEIPLELFPVTDQSCIRFLYHNPAHIEWEKRQAAKHANKPEMKPTVTPVEQHECSSFSEMNEETITPTASNTACGNKYHRTIKGVTGGSAVVDVYCVLEAFAVTCPARQHAIKKLLCAGLRGKGDSVQDLSEAMESVSRAIVLEKQRKE